MFSTFPLFFALLGCGEQTEVRQLEAESRAAPHSEPGPDEPPPTPERRHDRRDRIAEFWSWWDKNQQRLLAVMGQSMPPELIEEFSQQVSAIHPKFAWEFGAGVKSDHSLAITGEGDALLRMLAETWRRAGPPDDEHWEFYTTKQPIAPDRVGEFKIGMHDAEIDFGSLRFGVEEREHRRLVDVVVYHPGFAALPENVARHITFVMLDSIVGESNLETWIGAIDTVVDEPPGAQTPLELRTLVDGLPERWPEGDAWLLAKATDPETGQLLSFALNAGPKRWNNPFLETWVQVSLPYADRGDGMCDAETLDVLNDLEDVLVAVLEDDALYLGHRTGLGERQIYFYVDGDSDAADQIRDWATSLERAASVVSEFDPSWSNRP